MSKVLSALQAGSRGTQACINAASTVSGIIGDLDTTIMFASAGTLNAEGEEAFADHRYKATFDSSRYSYYIYCVRTAPDMSVLACSRWSWLELVYISVSPLLPSRSKQVWHYQSWILPAGKKSPNTADKGRAPKRFLTLEAWLRVHFSWNKIPHQQVP